MPSSRFCGGVPQNLRYDSVAAAAHPVPVEARRRVAPRDREGRRIDGDETDAGRAHQPLLRRADGDVDAQRVHRERRRAQRRDHIGDEQRRMAGARRSRARSAARSLVMPLAVSVWTANTALISCAASSRSACSTASASIGQPSRHGVRTTRRPSASVCTAHDSREVAGAGDQHRARRARPGSRPPLPTRRGRWRRTGRRRRRRCAAAACSPASQAAMIASTRGSARSIGCALIACSTASGTGVGPGECRKRRPGMRVEVFMRSTIATARSTRSTLLGRQVARLPPPGAALPLGLALVDEGLHAFERRVVHHVAGHGARRRRRRRPRCRFRAGGRTAPCPARSRPAAWRAMLAASCLDRGVELRRRHTTRLTRPFAARLVGVDEFAGDQHLERALRPTGCGQRHAGRRAEQAEVDAADGEARVARAPRPGRTSPPAGSRRRWRCRARARSPAPAGAGSPASCGCTARTASRSSPATARRASPSGRGRRRRRLPAAAITTTRARCVGGHAVELGLQRVAAWPRDSALKACGRFSVSVTTPRASVLAQHAGGRRS